MGRIHPFLLLCVLFSVAIKAETVASFSFDAIGPNQLPKPTSIATWQSADLAKAVTGDLTATATGQPGQQITWSIPLRQLPKGSYDITLLAVESGIAARNRSAFLANAAHRTTLFTATGGAGKERLTAYWDHASPPNTLIITLSPAAAAPASLSLNSLSLHLQGNFPSAEQQKSQLEHWKPKTKLLTKDHLGRVQISIDGRPVRGLMREMGIPSSTDIMRVPINLGATESFNIRPVRPYPNYLDVDALRDAMAPTTESTASIWLDLNLRNIPKWLQGRTNATDAPLDVGKTWRSHVSESITAALAEIAQHPSASRIIGATINLSEANLPSQARFDHPLYLPAFRKWLRTAYTSNQDLATAWQEPNLTIDTALPLSPKSWQQGTLGPWIHPAQQPIIDSRKFFNLTWADSLLFAARKVSESLPGIAIAISNGPFLALTGQSQQNACTAFALEKALKSPHLDAIELTLPPVATPALSDWFSEYNKTLIVRPTETLANNEAIRRFISATAIAGAIPYLQAETRPTADDAKIVDRLLSRSVERTIWSSQETIIPLPANAFDFMANSATMRPIPPAELAREWLSYGLPLKFTTKRAPSAAITISHFQHRSLPPAPVRITYARGALADTERKSLAAPEHPNVAIRLSGRSDAPAWHPTAALDEFFGQRISFQSPGFPARSNPPHQKPGIVIQPSKASTILATHDQENPSLVLHTGPKLHQLVSSAPLVPHEIIRALLAKETITPLNSNPEPTLLRGRLLAIHSKDDGDVRQINFPAPTALYEIYRDQEIAPSKTHHLELVPNRTWLFYLGTRAQWNEAP